MMNRLPLPPFLAVPWVETLVALVLLGVVVLLLHFVVRRYVLIAVHFIVHRTRRLRRFVLLRDYIDEKARALAAHNRSWADDPAAIVNARRLTNVGTLRACIQRYLRGHRGIRQDLTLPVRQLAPTPEGLPIEIYAFTADTRWGSYEDVQADIFDHVLSIIPEFGLSVYQRPSGRDFDAAAADEGVLVAAGARAAAQGGPAGNPATGES